MSRKRLTNAAVARANRARSGGVVANTHIRRNRRTPGVDVITERSAVRVNDPIGAVRRNDTIGGTALGASRRAPSNPGVGDAQRAPLPPQLAKRVQSGAIDREQAERTATERDRFRRVFGDDWRTDIYGEGGARGIEGPFAEPMIKQKRTQALEQVNAQLAKGRLKKKTKARRRKSEFGGNAPWLEYIAEERRSTRPKKLL